MLEANGVDLGTHNKITDTLVQKQTKLKKNIKGTGVYTERIWGNYLHLKIFLVSSHKTIKPPELHPEKLPFFV